MRIPRLPALLALGIVFSPSLQPARVLAAEPKIVAPAPYVIAIDPGHGGSFAGSLDIPWDPGVVAGSLMEKDVTLDLGLRLRSLLQKERVRVVMTRTSDRFMTIADRWAVVAASGARMFVSLHVNAFDGDPSISGLSVLYPKDDSIPLAQAVESGLTQGLSPFAIKDDGVVAKPELWVHSTMPTVTVEPVYMTNPREAALLERSEFRQAIVQGIFQGLLAADPLIETTRKAIEQAQAAVLQAQRALNVGPGGVIPSLRSSWWLYLGSALVILLLIRNAAAPRPVPVRYRTGARSMRRRRTLQRRV